MRPLPTNLRDALRRLQQSWWGQRGGSRPDAGETARGLRELGAVAGPAAVPGLVEFLAAGDEQVAAAAAAAVRQIADGCGPAELARLDVAVRHRSDWNLPRVHPADVPRLARGRTATLGVLSFNGSGYVREAAVRALAGIRDGGELPYLLIRLNDWVEPVRATAGAAVRERVVSGYAPHFVACLPLVYRLPAQGRGDAGGVFEAVLALLRRDAGREALRAGLSAADRDTRRLSFRLLADAGGADRVGVLLAALAAADTVIRLWAARRLRQELTGEPLLEVLARLGRDRFMPVRREGLYGYAEQVPTAAAGPLRAALLDPHPSMREASRFYLRQAGEADSAGFAALYRRRLADAAGEELAAAAAGLGETGSAADAAWLVPLLAHPAPRVRRAAVRAVGRLDPEGFVGPLLAALGDEAAGVARAARDILRARPHRLEPGRLWAAFESARWPHGRRVVLSLIAELRWWDSAPLLVAAAGTVDEAARGYALEHLGRWRQNYHRLSVRPTGEQLGRLTDAIRLHRPRLDTATARDLDDHVTYARQELL